MSVHPVTTAADTPDRWMWCPNGMTCFKTKQVVQRGHFEDDYVLASDYEKLRAALTASEKDAARYQWLREQMHIAGAAIVEVLQPAGDWGNSVTAESPEGLDAAIDAAMEKANG